MNDELLNLKNLGKTSTQWLHAVGIHSATDLRRLGSVGAYRAVRARGFRASKVLLYAIEGALLDVHWNEPVPRPQGRTARRAGDFPRAKQELAHTCHGKIFTPPGAHLSSRGRSYLLSRPGRLKEMAMYLLGEQPAYADQLINRLQGIPHRLLEGLAPSGPALELERSDDLERELPADQVFLVESGLLHALVDERPLFYLQEGDLLGLRRGLELPACRHANEEPIRLLPYSRDALLQHIHADQERQELLLQYLIGQTALLGDALAHLKQPEVRPATGFRHFAAGEALIRQGDDADHVFIIIEGHAEALVDGQKVGDVQKDEIFGAMAVFTREKRSATVVASEPCTVMVIPKEQFLGLMQNNPRIAHSLIEGMARRIDLLNREVTQLRLRRSA